MAALLELFMTPVATLLLAVRRRGAQGQLHTFEQTVERKADKQVEAKQLCGKSLGGVEV